MQLNSFNQQLQGFIVNTSGTGNTSQSTQVILTSLGGSADASGIPTRQPTVMRMINAGTSPIWFSVSSGTSGTAVTIPTAGTTTVGTPSNGQWAYPGVEISLTLSISYGNTAASGPAAYGFWLNTISATATQPLYCVLGEGM